MRFGLLAVSVVFLGACESEQHNLIYYGDGPSGPEQDAGGAWLGCDGGSIRRSAASACELTTQRVVTSADESTLGFDAETFLELIRGEHRAQVSWENEGAPAGASSELTVSVEPRGDVRFVDKTARAGRGGTITFGNTGAVYYICGDHLAVDAEVRLVMPDGTLDETLEATIEAESGQYARLLVKAPSSSLVGSLRSSIEAQGADQLSLALGIARLGTGLEGTLAASDAQAGGNPERSTGCNTLGAFSLAQGCPQGALPLGSTGDVLGLSFAGALERLNATNPATLADTGASLSLAFSAEPVQKCVSIDTPASLPAVLEFPGSVTLESSDGRVSGTLQVQLTAHAEQGRLQKVKAYSEYLAPEASGLAALAPSYAIREPLTWSALEMGGFEFLVEAHEQESGGLLRAIGGEVSCQGSRPCEEVCPGPSCTVSPAEKWAVRWGEMQLVSDLFQRSP